MFKENQFELFVQFEALPDEDKSSFLDKLTLQNPDKAQQLLLLSQDSHNFTEHFLENITDYSETISSPNLKLGDTFGVYTLVKPLGVGGMGHVYLAKRHDGLIEQEVAIKFLHPALYQLNSTQTLLNEAQALANLNHTNIATILDVVKTDDGLVYMVMEYINGCTLIHYLAQNKLSFKEKLTLFAVIADAVQEAHSQRIVHADIKPSNILITQSGKPKLIDFGIMQFVGVSEEKPNAFINQYLCAMTVNYAAPEQLQGQQASIQSDVYALGGLLYFILSGKTPFEEVGGSLVQKIAAISTNNFPTCVIPDKIKFRKDIDWILQTCLAKQSEQRFRSIGALNLEINNYLNYLPLSKNKSSIYKFAKSWQRHKMAYLLSMLFVIILATFTLKTWNDNVQLQKSYKEISKSFSNQKTTLQEVKQNKLDIILPSPDAIPIELYIELALQKSEIEFIIDVNRSAAKKTFEDLKKVLKKKNYNNKVQLLRIELAELSRNVLENSTDIIKIENVFKSLYEEDDLSQEIIIDILYSYTGEWMSDEAQLLRHKMVERVKLPLDEKAISVAHRVKFYITFSSYLMYSKFSPTPDKAMLYSKKAFDLAVNKPQEIPVDLFLLVLHKHVMAYKNISGYTLEYFEVLKQVNQHLNGININKDVDMLKEILSNLELANFFQSIKNFTVMPNSNNTSDFVSNAYFYEFIGDFYTAKKYLLLNEAYNLKNDGDSSNFSMIDQTGITEINLKLGLVNSSFNLITTKLKPFYYKFFSEDWIATDMQKFCIAASYHLEGEI
jgi:serine/threonine protein kinase